MSAWRPIDSAPTDGTEIDLWIVSDKYGGGRVTDVIWVNDYPVYGKCFVRTGTASGWWARDRGYDRDGDWLLEDDERATHWMPPPAAPDEAEPKGSEV